MIKPFTYFIRENLARKTTPNIALIRALLTKSELRIQRILSAPLQEDHSSLIFEDIYESAREAGQALMELRGYKPYSHEALVSFLKEDGEISDIDVSTLDTYRILRNNSVYLATHVSVQKCADALEFSRGFLQKIKKLVHQEI